MYCELRCGAEVERDAGFRAMCGAKISNEADHFSGQAFARDVPDRRVRLLKTGLIAAMAGLLVLGSALLWTLRSEKNATDVDKNSNLAIQETKTEQGEPIGSVQSAADQPSTVDAKDAMRTNASSPGELTRDTAAPLIKEYMARYRGHVTFDLYDSMFPKQSPKTEKYLKEQGFIKTYVHPTRMYMGDRPMRVSELTDKGKTYLIRTNDMQGEFMYEVKMCEVKFVRVTGIAKNPFGSTRVEYEWAYSNPTPFASAFISSGEKPVGIISPKCVTGLEEIRKDSIGFQLYDDGWRIE